MRTITKIKRFTSLEAANKWLRQYSPLPEFSFLQLFVEGQTDDIYITFKLAHNG